MAADQLVYHVAQVGLCLEPQAEQLQSNQPAFSVRDRFLKRVDERVALIDDILSKDVNLNVDEDIQTDPKVTTYATDDAVCF